MKNCFIFYIINSFFIFEFDENATLYDSEIFDVYPNNQLEKFYFGNYSDIYSEHVIFDSGEHPPLYYDNTGVNETFYFDAFDSAGNYYYFDEHLFAETVSEGIYNLTWNPMYSEHYNAWYYDAQSTEEELEDLRDYYNPHVDEFRYLYLSWADANAWKEWHLIEQPNVNLSTLGVVFEWYNETTEEYESVVYNQTLTEFETRHIAVESIYPYDTSANSGDFNLSQDYSGAQNLGIYSITGYYFNESEYEFDLESCYVISGEESIHVEVETGIKLNVFETIVVLINFTSGALSDYSQFRLLENPEAPVWTKNDSIYVDFEYTDLDYFLLLEDYQVGSEDSLFELLEYTRNANFVRIEQDNFVFDINYHLFDYENFSAQIELKNVLLMTDFNEDGTHEAVLEKLDVTGDGEYNVFKYGYVDPAGEISFHTIVSQARPSQTLVDKKESVSQTKWFGLKDAVGRARRSLRTTTIINNNIDNYYYSVQSDVDLDGLMDEETSLEIICNNLQVTTFTKEITVVEALEFGILEELRVSTFVDSSMSQTMVFTDIVSDEVVSTRVYEDAFPNGLTELNNVENYLVPVVSETISSQTPDLNDLFSLSHAEDNVPAEFDRVTTIENGEITTDNLLFATQTISIPGVYSEDGQGLDSYAIEAIKSIPAEGTNWINDFKFMSFAEKDKGGYYLYFDSGDDGIYETVFIMDENDNVVGIGFDYDQDSRFHPAKTVSVLKGVLWSENYQGISIENDYIHFKESDKEVGTFNEPTFSDVLFDVFLMDFKGDTSALICFAEIMATNQFEEEVTLLTMAGDIAQQVAAMLAGVVGGAAGSTIGLPHVGYMLGYLGTNLLFQSIKIIEREQFIAHRTFVLDSSDGEKVLGGKFWFDDMYGNVMPLTVFGSVGGVYAPVFLQTDKRSYSSDIILRELNLADSKASSATLSYTRPKLDYWLSTRNLAGYSDDEPLMTQFLSKIGVLNPILKTFGIAEYNHRKSSIYYVENEIKEETFENGDAVLNTIVPTIDYGGNAYSPRMSFADSQGGLPTPEFYTEYPVFVSEDSPELEDVGSIYKIIPIEDINPEGEGVEIQLFSGDIGLKAEIDSIDAYVLWSNFPAFMY